MFENKVSYASMANIFYKDDLKTFFESDDISQKNFVRDGWMDKEDIRIPKYVVKVLAEKL